MKEHDDKKSAAGPGPGPITFHPAEPGAPPMKWTTELVLFAIVMITLFFTCDLVGDLGEKFVRAKIKNDSQIAADTKRIADVLERAFPDHMAKGGRAPDYDGMGALATKSAEHVFRR